MAERKWGMQLQDAPAVVQLQLRVPPLQALLGALADVAKALGVPVQAVRADRVVSRLHVDMAWSHARRAAAGSRTRSDDPGVEFVLYLAGDRQIHRALRDFGATPGSEQAILLVALGSASQEALGAAAAARLDVPCMPWEARENDAPVQAARGWWATQVGLDRDDADNPSRLDEVVLAQMAMLAVDRP